MGFWRSAHENRKLIIVDVAKLADSGQFIKVNCQLNNIMVSQYSNLITTTNDVKVTATIIMQGRELPELTRFGMVQNDLFGMAI